MLCAFFMRRSVPGGSPVRPLCLEQFEETSIHTMKTKHPSAFLPLNRVAVTPTFPSARFAGRKTGATGPHLLMARMRVHCARLFIVLALAATSSYLYSSEAQPERANRWHSRLRMSLLWPIALLSADGRSRLRRG